MEITKFEHACVTVTKEGKTIVIDPGQLTTDFVVPENVIAIIITHSHADHFDLDTIEAIMARNNGALILAPADITAQLADYDTRTVNAGDSFSHEEIEFDFYGGTHAQIHSTIQAPANVGVMIDERFYYPGDSFAVPEKSVDILALPVAAPWLKISESIDFLAAVAPREAFPTHDAILSVAGQTIVDRMVSASAEQAGIIYERLDGQTKELL